MTIHDLERISVDTDYIDNFGYGVKNTSLMYPERYILNKVVGINTMFSNKLSERIRNMISRSLK
jgi:hypothetical protein